MDNKAQNDKKDGEKTEQTDSESSAGKVAESPAPNSDVSERETNGSRDRNSKMSTQTSSISLDTDYLRSRAGLLRIGEALISLCGIISESQGAYCGYWGMYSFYNFVVVTTLILAILILITYMLGLDKFCTFINCFMSVFINDALFAVLYLVATILMIITIGACRTGQIARIFAALFGVAGTIVVSLLALAGYQGMKANATSPKSDPA